MLSIRLAQIQILPVLFPILSSSPPMVRTYDASKTSSAKLMLVKDSDLSESLHPGVPGSKTADIFLDPVIQASLASRCKFL